MYVLRAEPQAEEAQGSRDALGQGQSPRFQRASFKDEATIRNHSYSLHAQIPPT
jgi:hypothetical protein